MAASYPDGDHNIAPYAGGDTGDGARGGTPNERGRRIPDNDLHSNATPGGPVAVREDIGGFALGSGDTARYPVYPGTERNTNPAVRGADISTGEFTNDSSLDVPGSLAPYAGTSNDTADASLAAGQGE